MALVKSGDTVKVHCPGKLNDGTIFDTSVDRGPLEFTLRHGRIIPGFEQALIGSAVIDQEISHNISKESKIQNEIYAYCI